MTANERLEREKDELKEKNVRARRLFVIAIVVILFLLIISYTRESIEEFAYTCGIGVYVVLPMLLLYSIEISENNGDIKFLDACIERNLEDERVTPDIKREFKLSREYVEIFLKNEASINKEKLGDAYNKKKLQKDYGARFFVKLVTEDQAELIVKRLDGEIVGKPEKITRFSYLREYFEPLKM